MGLMGIDVGTSRCKVSVFDFEGKLICQAFGDYKILSTMTGWHEINPEHVWTSVKEAISNLMKSYKGSPIRAISVSSFGEAVVALDKEGTTLSNSILYIDKRGVDETNLLADKLGIEKILGITGVTPHPMYSIGKIMWLKNNNQEVYNNTDKYLLFADYILFRLGAGMYTDYSLAARTAAFNIIEKEWSSEILECAGIEKSKFADPVQSGTVIGEIRTDLADEIGLLKGTILVSGGHDQPCAALGAGVIQENTAIDGMGTTECITPVFNRPIISLEMANNFYACVPHVIENVYVTYAFSFTSGSILKWYIENFGTQFQSEADKTGINIYDLLINKAIKKPSDIFVLPHFAGAATPYMDTKAKGAFIGIDINTSQGDIIKGILEGITYEMMINLERLDSIGIKVNELRAVGGLAKSEELLQLKANMMGKKIVTLNVTEAGTLGAAILAGIACGIYSSYVDACKKIIRVKKEFLPDKKMHVEYQERYSLYKRMYPLVKSFYK